jgi:formate hydrogenlyase subunit 6/NADH:ubiquinone oxidoreductase subunit I
MPSIQILLDNTPDHIFAVFSISTNRAIGEKNLKVGNIIRDVLRALLRKPVTVQYLTKPGENVPTPERYRGKIVFDKEACIGCLLCIKVCPSGTITSAEERKVEFNLSRCLFCGQCVEICPKDAIKFSLNFELVTSEKEALFAK